MEVDSKPPAAAVAPVRDEPAEAGAGPAEAAVKNEPGCEPQLPKAEPGAEAVEVKTEPAVKAEASDAAGNTAGSIAVKQEPAAPLPAASSPQATTTAAAAAVEDEEEEQLPPVETAVAELLGAPHAPRRSYWLARGRRLFHLPPPEGERAGAEPPSAEEVQAERARASLRRVVAELVSMLNGLVAAGFELPPPAPATSPEGAAAPPSPERRRRRRCRRRGGGIPLWLSRLAAIGEAADSVALCEALEQLEAGICRLGEGLPPGADDASLAAAAAEAESYEAEFMLSPYDPDFLRQWNEMHAAADEAGGEGEQRPQSEGGAQQEGGSGEPGKAEQPEAEKAGKAEVEEGAEGAAAAGGQQTASQVVAAASMASG
ncbi:hypothetical protein GPECTOR_16g556 [Gonium pectorale]|uniref:Uncharacterized protein n=1 Tax=Gonium pectorale TaxID=33097 RepID=A0A150GKN7_GONPE|nr:hypothetical protein GPECTOR_16g556 [Gonium pectorale]|eukprot:KXZ50383.1 hypothetical protein GPECTOR_16g556 [Gonium pectorale]